MNFVPELSLSLTNAWIGAALPFFTVILVLMTNLEAAKRAGDISWQPTAEKILSVFRYLLMFGITVYSFWVPIIFSSIWFYFGLLFWTVGFVCMVLSVITFVKTPMGKPVLKGFYKISRNPWYFFYGLLLFGVFLATQSISILVLVVLLNVVEYFVILSEERYLLRQYGKAYEDYLKKVPRYFIWF